MPWVLQTTLIVIVLVTSFSLALSSISQVYAQMSISVGFSGGYYGCPWWYWYSGYCPYYGYYGNPGLFPSAFGYSYYAQPTQYQLTVNTDPSTLKNAVSGAGAYNMGSSATFSINQTIIQVSQNARYVFSHWTGDYSGQNSTGTLTMDAAKAVTAVYQLQYYLAIVSPGNVPIQGSGWYNSGDSVTLTALSPIGGTNSRLVFNGWTIDGVNGSTNPMLPLQMNGPHVISAQYKQQYYLIVTSNQGGATSGTGWYDAGTLAQISASAPPSPAYGISMVFNGWNGTVTSPTNQQTTVLMNAPKTETATWRADATILYATVIMIIAVIFLATYLLVIRRRKDVSNPNLNATK